MARGKRQYDGCKQSIYFPGEMMAELLDEAKRLDRSVSWIVQQCCRRSGLEHVKSLPAEPGVEAAE